MDDRDVFNIRRKFTADSLSSNSGKMLNNKRANLHLSLAYAAAKNDEWLASELIEDLLTDYAGIVDDRRGVNNFAAATLELASKLKKDCKGWKSSLPLSGPNIGELLTNLKIECSNPSENGCTAALPTTQELDDFRKFMSASCIASDSSSFAQNFSQPSIVSKSSNNSNSERNNSIFQTNFVQSVQPVPPRAISNLYESKAIEGSNAAPFGSGGIYSNRVGGHFKKWGVTNKRKDSDEDDSIDQMESSAVKNYSAFRGRKASRGQDEHLNRDQSNPSGFPSFKTASEQLREENQKKYGNASSNGGNFNHDSYQPGRTIKKSLGGKGSVNSKFVPPFKNNNASNYGNAREPESSCGTENDEVDERLKNVEPRMIELIKNEIMDCGSKITWDDIAGLHFAKTTIQEIVVWPMLRPDIFTGLRRPPKGILLFGPPGTGKTLIGKCIASQSGSTFFSISASSLTSKWIGEGEKMVRALFAVARVHQPSVVFIDEIDSLLSQRSETEHESSRRIKTEFLVQLDGAGTDEEDRLLVIGATNRPQELDEAARRRLVKRLYIPLPDQEARKEMIVQLMKSERNELMEMEIDELAKFTEGYSGADMKHLCQEACLGPIRSLGPSEISSISANQVRPVIMIDFTSALKRVHPSVGPDDLHQYVTWNKTYGSGI